ncbi:unnamed protein product, partial [Aureobasidium pullulans]
SIMSTPQFATFRRFVLTGSIAAVTATGAWYGAGLKMKQDIKQITELETYRANLMQKKIMLDKKIDELEMKKRKEERRRLKALQKLEKEKGRERGIRDLGYPWMLSQTLPSKGKAGRRQTLLWIHWTGRHIQSPKRQTSFPNQLGRGSVLSPGDEEGRGFGSLADLGLKICHRLILR